MNEEDKRAMWMGVARTGVSAVIAAVAVIFFFGGREAKINDVVTWKTETAPVIKRIDSEGSVSLARQRLLGRLK